MQFQKLLLAFAVSFIVFFSSAQKIKILTSGTETSLRGLSVINDSVIWVSGSNGSVAVSTDGGNNWKWITVAGYGKRDYRDIEAFDAKTAIILAIDEPALLLKTSDGGSTWNEIYTDTTKGVFLDAMDFNKNGKAIIVGDPLEGKEYRLQYDVKHQRAGKINTRLHFKEGEAFFASSGTNIKWIPHTKNYVFVTGGKRSRFFLNGLWYDLPMIEEKESTGANSIAVWDKNNMVIVGGDFANDTSTTKNAVITQNAGRTWFQPATPPHGYRSCVEYITKNKLIACGTSGVDISKDGGMNWTLISNESFYVCQKSKQGKVVFLAGKDGRIARWKE